MSRSRSKLGALALIVAAALATTSAPRAAHAVVVGGLAPHTGKFLYTVCDPLGGSIFSCTKAVILADPQGDVTHIGMVLDYDFSGPGFVFDAALSGLLGPFAVGGSTPPATPGVGTQPLTVRASVTDVAGAPKPGWTLSVIDDGFAVTVDYLNVSGTPVTLTEDTNFFQFVFDFLHPVVVDAALSTVRYAPVIEPGATFAELSFVCETAAPPGTCGSSNPSASITLDLAPASVPEPSAVLLLAVGLVLLATVRRLRHR